MDRDKILYLALWWWIQDGRPVITVECDTWQEAVKKYISDVKSLIESI